MPINIDNYYTLKATLDAAGATLIAVSKTKPASDILELYNLGQRDFGENYVQELVDKETQLPKDIRWHFIGHLQSNKVKYIAPFVHLIHGVDSEKLLNEINKQGAKNDRKISALLQIHIAQEESKFGLDAEELSGINSQEFTHVSINGLMGMASFTSDKTQVMHEFNYLKMLFEKYKSSHPDELNFDTLSMGMSGDYDLAIAAGSNMVRIGSLLFGEREKRQ